MLIFENVLHSDQSLYKLKYYPYSTYSILGYVRDLLINIQLFFAGRKSSGSSEIDIEL